MLFYSAFETESCVFVIDFYSKRGFASSGANFHLCFMLSHFHGLRFSSVAAEQDGSLWHIWLKKSEIVDHLRRTIKCTNKLSVATIEVFWNKFCFLIILHPKHSTSSSGKSSGLQQIIFKHRFVVPLWIIVLIWWIQYDMEIYIG